MYLICDGGYLRWLQSMCPYVNATAASAEGYYSSNLESVRKDVECTFEIMKKRCKILNNGLLYCDIKVCEKIFVTCSCLHSMLVKDMKMNHLDTCVGIKCRSPSFFFTAHSAVSRINSRISARPPAASYLLRGRESKEARIHPL